MNVVTFETAKRLKDAGFPFLKIRHGIVFYNSKGSSILCANVGDIESRCCRDKSSPSFYVRNSLIKECYLAPTATDILREMPGADLYFWTYPKDKWRCYEMDIDNEDILWMFEHENPAEACALAWLALNEKQ